MVLIGGMPGAGKSSALVQVVDELTAGGVYALIASAEQERRVWERMSLARRCFLSYDRLASGRWPPDFDMSDLRAAVEEAQAQHADALNRRRYCEPFPRCVADLIDAARRFRDSIEGAPAVLVIDAVHNLRDAGATRTRREELDGLLDRLQGEVCEALDMNMLGASHLSREGRFKESGHIDYNAHALLTLESPESDEEDGLRSEYGSESDTAEGDRHPILYRYLRVTKQKDGPTGFSRLGLDVPTEGPRRLLHRVPAQGPEGPPLRRPVKAHRAGPTCGYPVGSRSRLHA